MDTTLLFTLILRQARLQQKSSQERTFKFVNITHASRNPKSKEAFKAETAVQDENSN